MLNKADIINALIKRHGYKKYLEIGVDDGVNFGRVLVDYKLGCDPNKEAATHKMTSDEFFKQNKETFDIILVDGLHLCDQVLKDVRNSLAVLSENGIILIHDCLPKEEWHQFEVAVPYNDWVGTTWKAIMRLRVCTGISVCVIDTDWGIGVVRRGKQDPLIMCPDRLTWSFYQENKDLMGIKPPEQFIAEEGLEIAKEQA